MEKHKSRGPKPATGRDFIDRVPKRRVEGEASVPDGITPPDRLKLIPQYVDG